MAIYLCYKSTIFVVIVVIIVVVSGYLVLGCVNGYIYKISLLDYTVTELWTEKDDIRVTHLIWLSKVNLVQCFS